MRTRPMTHRLAPLSVALTVALVGTLPATRALAEGESSAELQAQADEAQAIVREKVGAYNDALAKVQDLDAHVAQSEQAIGDIEGRLPALRTRAARSIRETYKMDQDSQGLVGLMLCSESFESLVATVRYMDVIAEYNSNQVSELVAAQNDLETARATLEVQRQQAAAESEAADQALAEAQQAAADLQAAADAARAAEQAAAALSSGQAVEAADPVAAIAATNAAARQAGIDLSSDEEPPTPARTSSEEARTAFVGKWGPRIDAYLAGRPLQGQGTAFAEAAWDNGVDPRWSAALSVVESGGGAACFAPYNAYGWLGRGGFESWEQGVREHAAYLRVTYGTSFTPASAAVYLLGDPTAISESTEYYRSVVAEMAKI